MNALLTLGVNGWDYRQPTNKIASQQQGLYAQGLRCIAAYSVWQRGTDG